jgi:predicted RNA binding protein YcfA (HicA-like mRNA interferase family)
VTSCAFSKKTAVIWFAKGSHEIWYSPVSNRNVTVPGSTKSRHTANDVLKQAGLDRAF